MSRTHLIIPDAHAKPHEDMRRFEWLANFILKNQPDVIVDIGDWADMLSLCSYDKGNKSFEGRSYKEDVEASKKANEIVFGAIDKYNNQRAKSKKKKYSPRIIRCLGNHDDGRIKKTIETQRELEGIISIQDLGIHRDGHEVYPFLTPVVVDNIAYCHYFTSGVMGRPVTSANALLNKKHMSSTMGHVHTFDFAQGATAGGNKIKGLFCGCFLDPDNFPSYTSTQVHDIWESCLILKHDVKDGNYDLEQIGIKRLMKEYG